MTQIEQKSTPLKLGLPKGRMSEGVLCLLSDAGISVSTTTRGYRPSISLPGFTAKTLKPQNIIEMLSHGRRDAGFAGADWVRELDANVVEILDTGLDRVRMVAAVPSEYAGAASLPDRRIVVTSEYERIAREWILSKGMDAEFVRSYGATEVFPPDDADLVIDIVATGATMRANGLEIIETLSSSSTRLYASRKAVEDLERRSKIEALQLLLESVLEARTRVMLEINASHECLQDVVALLPCMREATVSTLYGDSGLAVRAAVPKKDLPTLLPRLKAAGGTDIVVSTPAQIIP